MESLGVYLFAGAFRFLASNSAAVQYQSHPRPRVEAAPASLHDDALAGKLANDAFVDAEQTLQRSGCDLVTHGESLPLDGSEKEKAAAGATAIRWSR
jgi:hypothetical protein